MKQYQLLSLNFLLKKRQPTNLLNEFPIPAKLFNADRNPIDSDFSLHIYTHFKNTSFQKADVIAKGLKYLTDSDHVWQELHAQCSFGYSNFSKETDLRNRINRYVDRRNSIVHEADLHPVHQTITPLTSDEINQMFDVYDTLECYISGNWL